MREMPARQVQARAATLRSFPRLRPRRSRRPRPLTRRHLIRPGDVSKQRHEVREVHVSAGLMEDFLRCVARLCSISPANMLTPKTWCPVAARRPQVYLHCITEQDILPQAEHGACMSACLCTGMPGPTLGAA